MRQLPGPNFHIIPHHTSLSDLETIFRVESGGLEAKILAFDILGSVGRGFMCLYPRCCNSGNQQRVLTQRERESEHRRG